MNGHSGMSQAVAEAFIAKAIADNLEAKANEGKEPSDDERLAYGKDDYTVVEAGAGIDAVKPGKMAWCEGFKPSEVWATSRIRRTVDSQYGIDGTIDGAAQLCFRPDDPTWQKEGAYVLQKWMNWTAQSKADAEKSLTARVQKDKWVADREAFCKAIEVSEEVTGGELELGKTQRQMLGCENKGQPSWQDNQSPGDVAYYFDPNTNPPNELMRLASLFRSTSSPAEEHPDVVSYAAVQRDFVELDLGKLEKEMSAAPYNGYARVVANETYSYIKYRQKMFEPMIDKLTKDPDYLDVLRKAPKRGYEQWEKATAQWKAELARSNEFEAKLFGPSRKALKGCTAELLPDMQKLIKSYKLTDYNELRTRIAGDPIASLLMSRLALCTAFEKVYGLPGVLKDLVQGGRDLRGPRSMAFFAIQDAITDAKKDRPKFPLTLQTFVLGNASIDSLGKDFEMSGGIGYDIDKSEPRGVIGSVSKVPEGVEVKFKHSSYSYPEQDCHDDKAHPLKIDSSGNIHYYQLCKYTGKTVTEDTTPRPIVVASQLATNLKPGVYAQGQEYSARAKNGTFMGIVHFTKASPKDKKIETFYGFDL